MSFFDFLNNTSICLGDKTCSVPVQQETLVADLVNGEQLPYKHNGSQNYCNFNEQKREDILAALDNPEFPINKFIGNEAAIRQLKRSLFTAWSRQDHKCNDENFMLNGPASAGKTTVAKLFAESVCLPFVELDASTIDSANDILVKIAQALNEYEHETVVKGTLRLQLYDRQADGYDFLLPPCVIFIDEIHNLKKSVVQILLKPTENADGIMTTENAKANGGRGYVVNCRNVLFIGGTTDRGDLFPAFDTRFTQVYLKLYTQAEVGRIVQLHNPDLDERACDLAAFYCRLPREALSFARAMIAEKQMYRKSWSETAAQVAADREIDQYGMSKQRVIILRALGQQGPISADNLASIAGCKKEELKRYVMPILLSGTDDCSPLVRATTRGYEITGEGISELIKRNIAYKGKEPLLDKKARHQRMAGDFGTN